MRCKCNRCPFSDREHAYALLKLRTACKELLIAVQHACSSHSQVLYIIFRHALRSVRLRVCSVTAGASLGVDAAHSEREQPAPDHPRPHHTTAVRPATATGPARRRRTQTARLLQRRGVRRHSTPSGALHTGRGARRRHVQLRRRRTDPVYLTHGDAAQSFVTHGHQCRRQRRPRAPRLPRVHVSPVLQRRPRRSTVSAIA